MWSSRCACGAPSELVNVVDGSDSEAGYEEKDMSLEGIAEEEMEEEGEEEEEEVDDSRHHPSSSILDVAPDSTVPSEPSESLVTTTHS